MEGRAGEENSGGQDESGEEEKGEEQVDVEEDRDGVEERSVEGEQGLGKEWGHAVLPKEVYGNNPAGSSRGTRMHVVWKTVKYLKMFTAHGTTVNNKYTHVYVAPIIGYVRARSRMLPALNS